MESKWAVHINEGNLGEGMKTVWEDTPGVPHLAVEQAWRAAACRNGYKLVHTGGAEAYEDPEDFECNVSDYRLERLVDPLSGDFLVPDKKMDIDARIQRDVAEGPGEDGEGVKYRLAWDQYGRQFRLLDRGDPNGGFASEDAKRIYQLYADQMKHMDCENATGRMVDNLIINENIVSEMVKDDEATGGEKKMYRIMGYLERGERDEHGRELKLKQFSELFSEQEHAEFRQKLEKGEDIKDCAVEKRLRELFLEKQNALVRDRADQDDWWKFWKSQTKCDRQARDAIFNEDKENGIESGRADAIRADKQDLPFRVNKMVFDLAFENRPADLKNNAILVRDPGDDPETAAKKVQRWRNNMQREASYADNISYDPAARLHDYRYNDGRKLEKVWYGGGLDNYEWLPALEGNGPMTAEGKEHYRRLLAEKGILKP